MSAEPATTDRLRSYLLGTLAEDERQALEVELLRDDRLFEELQALEDEVVHDWAQGGEGAAEQGPVVTRLARTPDGRRRLAAARQLVAGLAAVPARARRATPWRGLVWLAAAAALLLVAGLAWWLVPRSGGDRVARGDGPVPPAVAPNGSTASPPPVELHLPPPGEPATKPALRESPPSRPPVVEPVVAVLALAPGLTRDGGGAPRVTLAREVEALRLTLRLPPEVPAGDVTFALALLSADGVELWNDGGLHASASEGAAAVVVDLPAAGLPEGDYELGLSVESEGGPRPLADYAFGVLRER